RLADRVALVSRELAREFRLQHVVEAGGAAAAVAVAKLHDPEARDRGEHLSRLAEDALRAERVAGVVVRDRDVSESSSRRFEPLLGEELDRVARPGRERVCARVVLEEVAILLEVRATSGRV